MFSAITGEKLDLFFCRSKLLFVEAFSERSKTTTKFQKQPSLPVKLSWVETVGVAVLRSSRVRGIECGPVSGELGLVHLLLCVRREASGAGEYVIMGLYKMEILLQDRSQHAQAEQCAQKIGTLHQSSCALLCCSRFMGFGLEVIRGLLYTSSGLRVGCTCSGPPSLAPVATGYCRLWGAHLEMLRRCSCTGTELCSHCGINRGLQQAPGPQIPRWFFRASALTIAARCWLCGGQLFLLCLTAVFDFM